MHIRSAVEILPAASLLFLLARFPVATQNSFPTTNGIRSQGSPDVMAIWNAKP